MKKDLTFLKGLCIAHRGIYKNDKIPENSLAAFKKCIEQNMAIELDVHILKDNNIVVFHDENLKRMTGSDKYIKDYTYEHIKNLKLLNTEEKIPLLKDVLELVDGRVLIDIELKSYKVGRLEKELIKLLDNYNGKFLVKSFNPFSVLWFKKNKREYITGQLSYDYKDSGYNIVKRFILKNMLLNCITKPDFIAYDINSITMKQIKKYKVLLLWTIKTKEQLEFAKKHSYAYICEKT